MSGLRLGSFLFLLRRESSLSLFFFSKRLVWFVPIVDRERKFQSFGVCFCWEFPSSSGLFSLLKPGGVEVPERRR